MILIKQLRSCYNCYFRFTILGIVNTERERPKQELNLDGIFINVKGVKISTEETNYFGKVNPIKESK